MTDQVQTPAPGEEEPTPPTEPTESALESADPTGPPPPLEDDGSTTEPED